MITSLVVSDRTQRRVEPPKVIRPLTGWSPAAASGALPSTATAAANTISGNLTRVTASPKPQRPCAGHHGLLRLIPVSPHPRRPYQAMLLSVAR